MLPSVLAQQLQVALADYVETTFPITNPVFRDSIKRAVEKPGTLFHEPYVTVRLPFRVCDEEYTSFQAVRPEYRPYVHQQKAFDRLAGENGRSTIIATGTGSGKTECFLYPILDYCYAHRDEPGIKALIIYPMNALAADQARRLAELIYDNPNLRGYVTAGMYVGGHESSASREMARERIVTDHETMLASPPHILLTNYKMLDYLLVRPRDAALWRLNNPRALKFIVVDELHTFDGAQGTDLACLLRRLKARLSTPPEHICCIGTSATMGAEHSAERIRVYAQKVFGEHFDEQAVITEDRLSPDEFFHGYDVSDYTFPTREQIRDLADCAQQEDETAYLQLSAASWLEEPIGEDRLFSAEGRAELSQRLMRHDFMRSLIYTLRGTYVQRSRLIEELAPRYLGLLEMEDATAALDSMLALISHARVFDTKRKLRPFLNVQVQIWIREWRRLLAKVSRDDVTFALASDLTDQQRRHYLPVVNCRDCGETGWTSFIDEQHRVALDDLPTFYNLFFRHDKKVRMLFPCLNDAEGEPPTYRLCPSCLRVQPAFKGDRCSCGEEAIRVRMPQVDVARSGEVERYVCPFCGSAGLAIIGLRSVTAVSAVLSQLYSSRFNDDKKLLAFSDNVQDAAHRAGFFNSRTWRFILRTAIQRFALSGGDGLALDEFVDGVVDYWHGQVSVEEFVTFFIPPNLTWCRAFEQMQEKVSFPDDSLGRGLLQDIVNRFRYEIFLEYGLASRRGRTLEKSGCSILHVDRSLFEPALERIFERLRNEFGELRDLKREDVESIVAGWIYQMKTDGAIYHDVYEAYIKHGAKPWQLSTDRIRWLPGVQPGFNTPRFVATQRLEGAFQMIGGRSWYGRWIEKYLNLDIMRPDLTTDVGRVIVDELQNGRILRKSEGPRGIAVWSLAPGALRVSTRVTQLVCDRCGSSVSVAKEDEQFWAKGYCVRQGCLGRLQADSSETLDYYGKLYSRGDLVRIQAREHTGLLKREAREQLESQFKESGSDRRPWYPNLLSSTPTLEMGIDIGDLSTVVLCNVPPGQSQYVQRVGRAGRRDGNSLAVAVASVRPHDQYFWDKPLEMIAGVVDPPEVFLNASAVLARQFVAYALDCWVKTGIPVLAIPRTVDGCLNKLKTGRDDVFPFNFLNYVQANLSRLHRGFVALFSDYLTDDSVAELRRFARGDGIDKSPMHVQILEAFQSLYEQREALRKNVRQLNRMIRELESKPRDSSYERELIALRSEQRALMDVIKAINEKDVFNFLSDEGLLPNYTFPEAGILLRAILYRRESESEDVNMGRQYQRSVYEYMRAAPAAISEFAPDNSFYAEGRRFVIDQVDVSTTKSVRWRLCPNCSHADRDEIGSPHGSCPRCGSIGWSDTGQVRPMLRVRMVYATDDYAKSLIGDESEERRAAFYVKDMLVDVDEERDVISAYQVGTDEFPFGYEFVQKAVMREINFGEKDLVGERLTVAGREEVRKGFRVCRYCGKIQRENQPPNHALTCRAWRQGLAEPSSECIFLYRELVTEALRVLIPSTTLEPTNVWQQSFVAAFMLGMKGFFGNVDHLRYCIAEVPIPESPYRKQYLVVYDSVPGGTGYLKQLMRSETAMMDIMETALSILESCSCQNDPEKDGCYHCLFAYRQSHSLGDLSRRQAITILRHILSGKDNVHRIPRLGVIPVNRLLESELERQFVATFGQVSSRERPMRIDKQLVNNKEGYVLQVGDCLWEIEPQVQLGEADGVHVPSRADFVFRPRRSAQRQKPIAVFTDGFVYHKDRVGVDTAQRMAIAKSGRYRVWTLTYKDVQDVQRSQGSYYINTLYPGSMPSGNKRLLFVRLYGGERLRLNELKPFELFLSYLGDPDAENVFQAHARAYAMVLLDPGKASNEQAFREWERAVQPIVDDLDLSDELPVFGDGLFGHWRPGGAEAFLDVWAGASRRQMEEQGKSYEPMVVSRFNDGVDDRGANYEAAWNGFWHFTNVMQFLERFTAVTNSGLQDALYSLYSSVSAPAEESEPQDMLTSGWQEILELLLDPEARIAAMRLERQGFPSPSGVGYELVNESGEVVAVAEMVWELGRVAWLLPSQSDGKELFEAQGWAVFVGDEIPMLLRQEA